MFLPDAESNTEKNLMEYVKCIRYTLPASFDIMSIARRIVLIRVFQRRKFQLGDFRSQMKNFCDASKIKL